MAMLERARKVIPLGSQTFSKSFMVYPKNAAPLFLERGEGSHVWDVDGNEYVDFVNGLAPVILGYNDPDVNRAAIEQIKKGVILSLPTVLETELAEILREIIPCAEMTRFGKNGTDATSAAIRIARAYTGRDRVAACGYHGWQDWYIGATTRNKGIPRAVCELTHKFSYNDLDSLRTILEGHPKEFAAVIMEPMTYEEPYPGFLQGVQDLAHEHGALFVLDEIVTGFRFHIGGAQTLFNITPDLASFGKSMGNGFPISAIVGKAEYMREMEEVFLSGTFGGEAVSLAASIATIGKMQREPVHETINENGEAIIQAVQSLISKHELEQCISIKGRPCWSFMQFRDTDFASALELKSLYMQELLANGILSLGTHNLSYSHNDADLKQLFTAQDQAFQTICEALNKENVTDCLVGPPIEQIFKIR
jgi:glutamate-1-semialdehyde 2,1-aminomutase